MYTIIARVEVLHANLHKINGTEDGVDLLRFYKDQIDANNLYWQLNTNFRIQKIYPDKNDG